MQVAEGYPRMFPSCSCYRCAGPGAHARASRMDRVLWNRLVGQHAPYQADGTPLARRVEVGLTEGLVC